MSEENDKTLALPAKQSLFSRFLCWIGHHAWEDMEPGNKGFCFLNFPLFGGGFNDWHKCTRCGIEEDGRCDECKKGGSGTCHTRIHKEMREQRLRENCCIHCPQEPHHH